jgi:hypothetical protein
MQEFSLEARPSRPLLLASITESLASTKPRKLQLPLLDAGFQAGLKRLHTGQLRGKPCEAPESPSDRQIRSHGLRGPNLGAAGAQLQHAAAVAGSVLVAAISQAAQRIASARLGRGSQNMPFHQSFKLPWKGAARSGSRRWGWQQRTTGVCCWCAAFVCAHLKTPATVPPTCSFSACAPCRRPPRLLPLDWVQGDA